jgi:hypothetical protein
MHPRHLRRALSSLVQRGAVVECNNVFRLSGSESPDQVNAEPSAGVKGDYDTGETMTCSVLQSNLNVRVDGDLRAEVEAVAVLMSRDGLRVKRSAVARCALVRGLRAMRDELTRAAGSSEVE